MTVAADFRALVAAHAPLVALVAGRIALNAVPQGSDLPLVVYTTSEDPGYTLDGAPVDYAATVEVQCWANTGVQSEAVAAQVRAAVESEVPAQRRGWVIARASSYDPALDLHAVTMAIEWWVSPA
jgi:hypothetical protein